MSSLLLLTTGPAHAKPLQFAFHACLNVGYSFWRDSGGHEVDCIIEEGGRPVPVEIKAGQTVNQDYFKGIRYWLDLAAAAKDHPAAIIYGGDRAMVREGVHCYPWWNF